MNHSIMPIFKHKLCSMHQIEKITSSLLYFACLHPINWFCVCVVNHVLFFAFHASHACTKTSNHNTRICKKKTMESCTKPHLFHTSLSCVCFLFSCNRHRVEDARQASSICNCNKYVALLFLLLCHISSRHMNIHMVSTGCCLFLLSHCVLLV